MAQAQSNPKSIRTPKGVEMIYANNLYCSYCPMVFSSLETKKRHEMYHEGNRPYSCNNCHVSFTRNNRLETHKTICREIDSLGKDIKWCSFCDHYFAKDAYLRKHYDKIHGILYDPKNPDVLKMIKRPSAQVQIEVRDSSFGCDSCGSHFGSDIALRMHTHVTHRSRVNHIALVGKKESILEQDSSTSGETDDGDLFFGFP